MAGPLFWPIEEIFWRITEPRQQGSATRNVRDSAPSGSQFGIDALRQREGVQRTARRNRDVLLPIHRIRHRRSDGAAAGLKMPERFSAACVESDEVALRIRAEHESTGRG